VIQVSKMFRVATTMARLVAQIDSVKVMMGPGNN
jgi:hypothetical protein